MTSNPNGNLVNTEVLFFGFSLTKHSLFVIWKVEDLFPKIYLSFFPDQRFLICYSIQWLFSKLLVNVDQHTNIRNNINVKNHDTY